MEEYREFLREVQKKGSKPHHIGHCLGSRDAWKSVRRNHWEALEGVRCPQNTYSEIINAVNKILAERLLEGHLIEFPYQMGRLEVHKSPVRIYMHKGKLRTTYGTDWKKTMELWYTDSSSKDSHKYIKRVQKHNYYIKYMKQKARFANQRFYLFRVNRSLSKKFGAAIAYGYLPAMQRQ